MKNSTSFTNKIEKAGVHRSKCTPAEILSFPTVSAFLLVLFLLCLLLLLPTQTFTDGACFRFLMEQICHVTLAVVHQHRIVFLTVGSFYLGRMESQKKTPQEIQKAIQIFAVKYGLLGLMTALPTTPNFMDYEAVYLPKNHFIREESMSTMDYLDLFFPFVKPDVVKRGVESMWNISNDRAMMALALTMSTDKPMAVNMSFQREYAEPYEWIKQQFIDIAFTYLTSVLFYEDYDMMSPEQRLLMQQGMEAFGTFTKQGYVLDKSRLINGQIFDEDYFDLISEIQEIRASERRFYQKITDIYATAVDYSVDSQITRDFFATVQNKMH